MSVTISLHQLARAAESRPEGYIADVLSSAESHDDNVVVLSDEAYERLRQKYSSPRAIRERLSVTSNVVRLPYDAVVTVALHRPPEFLRDLLEAATLKSDADGGAKHLEMTTAHFRRIRDKYGDLVQPPAPEPAPAPPVDSPPAPTGPGTQLKGLLKLIGITASPNCSCNARAAQMDEWGPDECEARMEEIVTWLGEEAKRRHLPYVRLAGEQLVKLAIRRARAAAAKAG